MRTIADEILALLDVKMLNKKGEISLRLNFIGLLGQKSTFLEVVPVDAKINFEAQESNLKY